MDSRTRDLQRIGKRRFGYDSLLPGQEDAMKSVLDRRDTLVVMPTGSGKSAIYQLPALSLPGPTLIVSPLIALQVDQVEGLIETGKTDAAYLNSTLTESQREEILERLLASRLEFLFLAPEQLANERTLERLSEASISLFVVDEAHCISAWGHDFRPEYLRLASAIDKLGHPTILAMTATASPLARDEILERLGMKDPRVFVHAFDRPNIHLAVERFSEKRLKKQSLLERVEDSPTPGIVYVATKKTAEELAQELLERNVSAVFYHGGMNRSERERVQADFMNDDTEGVVATTAFGMGIDKPNVRFVFHYDVPDSIDSYYQEIGRAGRDGEPASATLFYRSEDLGIRRFFAGGGRVDVDRLQTVAEIVRGDDELDLEAVQRARGLSASQLTNVLNLLEEIDAVKLESSGEVETGSREIEPEDAARRADHAAEVHERIEQSRLEMMRAFAETAYCRGKFLLNYFGEEFEGRCDHCDNCELEPVAEDPAKLPFELNERVTHSQWGEGLVVRYEGDKMMVLFDEVGYKQLSMDIVSEGDLLKRSG